MRFDSVGFDGIKGIEIEAFNSMYLHGICVNPLEFEGIRIQTALKRGEFHHFRISKHIEFDVFTLVQFDQIGF